NARRICTHQLPSGTCCRPFWQSFCCNCHWYRLRARSTKCSTRVCVPASDTRHDHRAAPKDLMAEPILSVQNLSIDYKARRGRVHAIRNVSFDLYPGEALGLIGESGSGKTTLGLGLVQLLPSAANISHGRILYRPRVRSSRPDGVVPEHTVEVTQ